MCAPAIRYCTIEYHSAMRRSNAFVGSAVSGCNQINQPCGYFLTFTGLQAYIGIWKSIQWGDYIGFMLLC